MNLKKKNDYLPLNATNKLKQGQLSYHTKLRQLKKQYKLYDAYLVEEKPDEKSRYKLINEMGRISALIAEINQMNVGDFFSGTNDYHQQFQSKINRKFKYLKNDNLTPNTN